ncbi:MAG TPA: tRNA threonylcarbamoyladenosine dehydratase [Firmicutes bacterium]|jgi:tRNA A37 threonylcarbamoyladenosine dehydratase|nr:tRNA threonylcarbamoyladenosine dehydratase [Bacillota bacterium]
MDHLLRTSLVIGKEAIAKLSQCRVIICGLGGVGGYATEALARSGLGFLTLIDGDVVEETNLNRQLIATLSTIGKEKTKVMAERVKEVSPTTKVSTYNVFLSADNLFEYICNTDYVIDCIDDIGAKTALIVYCLKNNIPLISSMGAGGRVDPTLIQIADISETTIDPLARTMRRRLREHGISQGLKVVYSQEKPVKAQKVDGEMVIGSTAFVPPAFGLALASFVIRDLIS